MKLRNKKTGEIGTLIVDGAYKFVTNFAVEDDAGNRLGKYDSLAELNEEWEDYEEPKEYWTIDWSCIGVTTNRYSGDDIDDFNKSIGNYFETKEEAEKAVKKLKAWKRLKDKGFRFRWIDMQTGQIKYSFYLEVDQKITRKDEDDLLLLFGGEE